MVRQEGAEGTNGNSHTRFGGGMEIKYVYDTSKFFNWRITYIKMQSSSQVEYRTDVHVHVKIFV